MVSALKILLVEDSPSDAQLLQENLAQVSFGQFDLTHVERLDEAISHLKPGVFDVVLLDLTLPDSSGLDTFLRLRHEAPNIPLVVLTGVADEMVGLEAIRRGVQDYLIKGQSDGHQIARSIRYAIERRQAEQALRESEERFRLASDAAHALVYDVDYLTGRANSVHGLPALLGYQVQEMPQTRDWWFSRIHPEDLPAVKHQLQEALLSGGGHSIQYRLRKKNGEYIFVEDTGQILRDKDCRPSRLVGGLVDITERKRSEEALRESEERYRQLANALERKVRERTADLRRLASELTHTEERERRYLAQAIHDNLQQLLVGAKLCTETLRRRGVAGTKPEVLEQLSEFVGEAIEVSRTLTFELSPPILYDAGLAPALEWMGRWMKAKHGLTVKVQADRTAEPEDLNVRVVLFQCTRELLFNVVKHAHVTTAEVCMRRFRRKQVEITVKDEGKGFDPAELKADSESGFGLFNIRGRLELLGGSMKIKSAPDLGSRFYLLAPRVVQTAERPAKPTRG